MRRREKDPRRTAKSIRSHEKTMAAYDRQIDTPIKYLDSNHWPEARTKDFRPVGHGDELIVPGMGHVTTYDVNIAPSGRYRGIDLTRRGTQGIGDSNNMASFYNNKNAYARKIDEKLTKKQKKNEENNG